MIPKLVTFDCAQTMVAVPQNWSMGWFAACCAREIGLNPSEQDALTYQRLYNARLPEFVEVNMTKDPRKQSEFWARLAKDWLREVKFPESSLEAMVGAADELGFGPKSILFKLYGDVIPCLDRLRAMGIRAAVVSNWDYSLHRVLAMFGLNGRFDVVKASLEEGVEKPDPRLFHIALAEAGFKPDETLHVGDDPVDDIQGAQSAGIRSVQIDRGLLNSRRPIISTLGDLTEAFDWID